MSSNEEKLIKDAQYRKGLSIAFFNATNAAIELVKSRDIGKETPSADIQGSIRFWRNWFLNEHKDYYGTVIAKIGGNFDVEVTLQKVSAVNSLKELESVWRMMSEDERHDEVVIKVVKDKKQSYVNPQ